MEEAGARTAAEGIPPALRARACPGPAVFLRDYTTSQNCIRHARQDSNFLRAASHTTVLPWVGMCEAARNGCGHAVHSPHRRHRPFPLGVRVVDIHARPATDAAALAALGEWRWTADAA